MVCTTLSAGGRWIRTSCSAPIDNGLKASSDAGPIDGRRDGVIRAVARLGNPDVAWQVDQLPLIIEPAGPPGPRCQWWECIAEPEV
jgi:hypothetical protein